MISAPSQQRHSAQVDMHIVVGLRTYELAQAGPDFVIFAEPTSLAPETQGELVVTVDGEETRAATCLPKGVEAGVKKTPISGAASIRQQPNTFSTISEARCNGRGSRGHLSASSGRAAPHKSKFRRAKRHSEKW
jgi:hypothetical protein